jgi:probable phosphoglycerate mutase
MESAPSYAFAAACVGILAYVRHRKEQSHLGWQVAKKFRSHNFAKKGNRFFIVRHGQSEANVAKIISSDPAVGTKMHGLTDRGKEQARRAGSRLFSIMKENGVAEQDISKRSVIICSDFLRTRMTAQNVAKELASRCETSEDDFPVTTNISLRERYFGRLDGQGDENYERVWFHDNLSCMHNEFGSESVASVLSRAGSLILDLDSQYEDKFVILVAHGDVAQITYTGFQGPNPPAWHRRGEPLQTGSVTPIAP